MIPVASEYGQFTNAQCPDLAMASETLYRAHTAEMSRLGLMHAQTVDRELWAPRCFLHRGKEITELSTIALNGANHPLDATGAISGTFRSLDESCKRVYGGIIQQKVHKKVLKTWEYFFPPYAGLSEERKQDLRKYSYEQISATPSLFNEMLLIADEVDLGRILARNQSKNFEEMTQEERVSLLSQESCARLHTLHVDNTAMKPTRCPKSIARLTGTTALTFKASGLKAIPEGLWTLPLRNLDLSENELTELSPSCAKLGSSVISFNLRGNKLKSLPDIFDKFSTLQTLDIPNNQLSELPQSFRKLKEIHHLDLSTNQLTTIPKYFRDLPLKHLIISKNPLTRDEVLIDRLVSLEKKGCIVWADTEVLKQIHSRPTTAPESSPSPQTGPSSVPSKPM